MKKAKEIAKTAASILFILIGLGMMVLPVYVITHFVLKYW